MKLGFIGTGKIASSVITGIWGSNISFDKILISSRNKLIAKKLKTKFNKVIIAKDGLAENTKLNETLPLDMEKIKKWGFLHALGGNVIVIEHKNNEYSFIAHCVKGSIKVKEGQRVKQGQPLAQLGNTGNSTAPHLRLFCLWP